MFGPQRTASTAVIEVRDKLPTSGALCGVVVINKSSVQCPTYTVVTVTFTTPLVSEENSSRHSVVMALITRYCSLRARNVARCALKRHRLWDVSVAFLSNFLIARQNRFSYMTLSAGCETITVFILETACPFLFF